MTTIPSKPPSPVAAMAMVLLGVTPVVSSTWGIALLVVAFCVYQLYQAVVHVAPITGDLEEDLSRPLPWPLRMIGFFVDSLPFDPWDLSDANALLEQGAADAGLSVDEYSPLVVESLHKFCDSLKSDNVKLNWAGRKNIHFVVTSGLTQYLLIHRHAKEYPELAQTKLTRPVVVVGLPRSGTTHLHRLLVEATKSSMPIAIWQHLLPFIPRFLRCMGLDLRRLYLKVNFFGWQFIANHYGMDAIHYVRPHLADECHFSLRMGGGSFLPWNMAPVFAYCDWLLDQEASSAHVQHAYETYRLLLQFNQAQNPQHRFVLKCPTHTMNISTLRRVVPEAAVVITHRDPCKTTLSYCSLNVRTQMASCASMDWRRSVQQNLKKDVMCSKALMKYCQENPNDPDVYHVPYKQLVADPVKLVKNIRDTLNISMVDNLETTMKTFLAQNQQHSHGVHRYSYEGMELSRQQVAEAYSSYKTHFNKYM